MDCANPQGAHRPQSQLAALRTMQTASALARLGFAMTFVMLPLTAGFAPSGVHAARSGRDAELSKDAGVAMRGAYVSLVWRLRKRLCMLTAMP